jgi:hypothetical protein
VRRWRRRCGSRLAVDIPENEKHLAGLDHPEAPAREVFDRRRIFLAQTTRADSECVVVTTVLFELTLHVGVPSRLAAMLEESLVANQRVGHEDYGDQQQGRPDETSNEALPLRDGRA